MKFFLTVFVYLIVLTCSLAVRQRPGASGSRSSRRGGGAQPVSDFIDIDAAHDEGVVTGSGDGNIDDTEPSGDDDDDLEASGAGSGGELLPTAMPTLCQVRRQRVLDSSSGSRGPPVGAFTPRCALDGSFDAVQCHGSTGYCWCVDAAEGIEITGTRRREKPDCSPAAVAALASTAGQSPTTVVGRRQPSTTSQGRRQPLTQRPTAIPLSSTTSRTTSFSRAPTSSVEIVNKIDQIPNEPDNTADETADTENNYVERPVLVSEPKSRRMSLRASVIGQPGILAAIIGGAVIVLLCLVLLVMFIVYRMHRKSQDPAIYYIDKSSRAPLTGGNNVLGNSHNKAGYMKAMDNDVYG